MRIKIRQISFTILLLFFYRVHLFSQVPDTLPFVVTLDSVTIEDVRSGFSVDDFISFVQKDTSFYEAFHNLRKVNYNSRTNVRMFDNDHLSKASYTNLTKQTVARGCRSMQFSYEASTGDFFDKKGEMNYYTSRVFSYIFLYRDTVCTGAQQTQNAGSDSKLEQRKQQLKTLLFRPGQPVEDIPLIKNKMEIFSEEMAPFYDYKIESKKYATGIDCYVFTVQKKENVEKGSDVVINELVTWFDKKTMDIVSRQYSLSYFSSLFDFDVAMDVKLTTISGLRVPAYIHYNGYWDIPLRKPEVGSVEIFIW